MAQNNLYNIIHSVHWLITCRFCVWKAAVLSSAASNMFQRAGGAATTQVPLHLTHSFPRASIDINEPIYKQLLTSTENKTQFHSKHSVIIYMTTWPIGSWSVVNVTIEIIFICHPLHNIRWRPFHFSRTVYCVHFRFHPMVFMWYIVCCCCC